MVKCFKEVRYSLQVGTKILLRYGEILQSSGIIRMTTKHQEQLPFKF